MPIPTSMKSRSVIEVQHEDSKLAELRREIGRDCSEQDAGEIAPLMEVVHCWNRDFLRTERVRNSFPDVYERLRKAAARIRADEGAVSSALRHPIAAEALSEVLEYLARQKDGAKFARQFEPLVQLHWARVGEKLRALECMQNLSEIQFQFPEINIRKISQACSCGRIPWHRAALFLQSQTHHDDFFDNSVS